MHNQNNLPPLGKSEIETDIQFKNDDSEEIQSFKDSFENFPGSNERNSSNFSPLAQNNKIITNFKYGGVPQKSKFCPDNKKQAKDLRETKVSDLSRFSHIGSTSPTKKSAWNNYTSTSSTNMLPDINTPNPKSPKLHLSKINFEN